MGYGGIMPVGVTYLTEYLPDNRRGSFITGIDIFRSIGGLLAIFAAWLSGENWRFFVLSPVPLFTIALVVIIVFLPESSRYLLYTSRIDQLERNLNEMCKQNGSLITIKYSEYDDYERDRSENKRSRSIWKDLVIKRWKTTIPLAMLWFFPAFGTGVYVFLPEIMLMKDFTMDQIYLLSSFLMIAPMIGVFFSSFFIDTFGRQQVIRL